MKALANSDEEVLRVAVAEEHIILTFDRDYGELLFRYRHSPPPAVVYFFLPKIRHCFSTDFFFVSLAQEILLFLQVCANHSTQTGIGGHNAAIHTTT